jgi:integration host factor subunit beta
LWKITVIKGKYSDFRIAVHTLTNQGRLMNKVKLIQKVSERMDIPFNADKVVVYTIFDSMKESLEKGEGIEIRGFGSFVVRKYGAYKGRNPKTGKIVNVPPKNLLHFKVGKELKEKVNTIKGVVK